MEKSKEIPENGLMQEENTAIGDDRVTEEMSDLSRQAGAEGCVLLKNDGALPLNKGKKAAIFGRCQLDWFYVGYGSGGDVHPPYFVNLTDGLKNTGVLYDTKVAAVYEAWCNSREHTASHGEWGNWPMSHPEMPLSCELVEESAKYSDTAIVVIGRAAGEDRENTLTEGSYYLTSEEKAMLDVVTKYFTKTVVLLNIGNIMDMSWIEEYGDKISSVMIVWQGGMESGNAVADVLTGKVSPCGKLSDTIAKQYEDYPSSANFGGTEYNNYKENIYVGYRYFETYAKDKVLYPFGYGLSYTSFSYMQTDFRQSENKYEMDVQVENVGNRAGKEVLLLWCQQPQGNLGKPAKVLTAYQKSGKLEPGEKELLTLRFDEACIASYDETGVTGYPNAFVLEAGEYHFYLGEKAAASLSYDKTKCIRQCESVCNARVSLRERILERLPEELSATEDEQYSFTDVVNGTISLEKFIASLSDEELEALTRGEGEMDSELGIEGNAGAFAGVIASLRQKGVPPIITTDGPAGLRIKRHTALLPCGTALACTWNDALIEQLYAQIGKEMRKYQVDVILSPGMNIHRNPLCGRNFEYFSEDPLLTGKIAAAVVRGVQSQGGSCCPKHFACNNQETRRSTNDSRLSERTLREIYLRGFEICVKEAKPDTIMTSYNKINGVWSHYNYDLATTILRKEWGFEGIVLTDWWMQKSISPEFPKIRDNAYRIRAQVDVLMPGNMIRTKEYVSDKTLFQSINQEDGITRAEIQRTAGNVLRFVLKKKADK